MSFTREELLQYHQEKYVTDDKETRLYVLAHGEEIFDGSESYLVPSGENSETIVDIHQLEWDVENLPYEEDEDDPRNKKYLEERRRHRERFLKEKQMLGVAGVEQAEDRK